MEGPWRPESTTSKLVARAVCAKRLVDYDISEEDLAAAVDTWWRLSAAELEFGLIDETGECVGDKTDCKRKTAATANGCATIPKAARFGKPLLRN